MFLDYHIAQEIHAERVGLKNQIVEGAVVEVPNIVDYLVLAARALLARLSTKKAERATLVDWILAPHSGMDALIMAGFQHNFR